MHWSETDPVNGDAVPDVVVDAVFTISGRALPVDHAWELSQAVHRGLPWFASEEGAGLHLIHGPESGNGWLRPDDPHALLYLSHRTKLVLRIPRQRIAAAGALLHHTLDVGGHALRVESLTLRALSRIPTLMSRHVVIRTGDDEAGFLEAAAGELGALGIRAHKMLCGLVTPIVTPARTLQTCSLMLADLTLGESLRLQEKGLGPCRELGCGLFLPHKDIDDVRRRLE
ncbi:MAG: type I-MYXAN CRISPR-associated protein Cas6/Cmx6 [Casimicrobiaceae bacterium]